MAARYASVLLDRAGQGLAEALTYEIPPSLEGRVERGHLVLAPLRTGLETGFVVAVADKAGVDSSKVRPLYQVLGEEPVIPSELFELAHWLAYEYFATVPQAFRAMLPGGLRRRVRKIARWITGEGVEEALARSRGDTRELVEAVSKVLSGGEALTEQQIIARAGVKGAKKGLRWLVDHQFARLTWELAPAEGKARKEVRLRVADHLPEDTSLTDKQASVVAVLMELGFATASELAREAGVSASVVKALQTKEVLVAQEERVWRDPAKVDLRDNSIGQPLTDEQKTALAVIEQALEEEGSRTVLLQGVTGSGKTRVYMEAISRVLERGKTALVLVPEISLTAQVIGLAAEWFGAQVAVWHSALSTGERFDEWQRVRSGEARLVIGARSAVLAPVRDLGLIVVDEEFENSYKQDSPPRYHAVEVAEWRAAKTGAAVVLASATPSLEAAYRAETGQYLHARLTERIGESVLPAVSVIDLGNLSGRELAEREYITEELENALRERLARGEQSLLFLNRRGFSPLVSCNECNQILKCPSCEISLTYHRRAQALKCHYCGYETPLPETCSKCGGYDWRFIGAGTERLEDRLHELLPDARIGRMDRDTINTREGYVRVFSQMRAGELDILLGTQMVTKGFDFPKLTLVGVLLAEQALGFSDFRAGERTFQLLVQVAGRAGRRDTQGQVLLQTYDPEHYAIKTAIAQDYDAFYQVELEMRRQACYPPFGELYRIVCRDVDGVLVRQRLVKLEALLKQELPAEVSLLPPTPCPFERLQGQSRWHLLLKTPRRELVHKALWEVMRRLAPSERKGIWLEVGPRSLL